MPGRRPGCPCLPTAWKFSPGATRSQAPPPRGAVHRLTEGRWGPPGASTQTIVESASSPRPDPCCTHRPSLLPIEWLSEAFGLAQGGRQRPPRAGKFVKLGHLEEVKVVTRFPSPGLAPGDPPAGDFKQPRSSGPRPRATPSLCWKGPLPRGPNPQPGCPAVPVHRSNDGGRPPERAVLI